MRKPVLNGCRINGRPCSRHGGVIHGCEAEELRAGIEKLIEIGLGDEGLRGCLQRLLDRTDARDSLAFLEAKDEVPNA